MFHKEKVTLGHRRKRPRGIITPEVDDVEIELVTCIQISHVAHDKRDAAHHKWTHSCHEVPEHLHDDHHLCHY